MWTDLVAWFQSAAGMRVVDGAIVPFVAIVVAGLVAGLIARATVRGVLAEAQRELATTVLVAVLEAARRAATAGDRSAAERAADEQFTAEAELRLRLLPVVGAELAADWVVPVILALRSPAEGDDRDARTAPEEIRSRLIRWLRAPKQARRLFPRPVPRRPAPAEAKASKRDAQRRSTAVDVPAGAVPSAALEGGRRIASGPDRPGDAVAAPAEPAKSEPSGEPLTTAEAPVGAVLVDDAAPGTAPVPLARHVAPATINPTVEERLGPEPIVDHRSSRQADDDDDDDFMQGSDQQGPEPVPAIPIRETAQTGQ